MRVSYVSACLDASGYAEAARNHIAALDHVGIKVDVKPVTFEGFKSDLGKLGVLIHSMVNQKAQNDIQILHLTPENYVRYKGPGKYNIGYCAWETSKLPSNWIPMINALDEVWVPCEHNKRIFKNSGITIPIFCMPHPLDENYIEQVAASNAVVANRRDDDFVFYSIFQWTERKNPAGLLKAYLTEFSSKDSACLVLKTYLANPSNTKEIAAIKGYIRDIKAKLYQDDYPRILLISTLLSRQQIQSLHAEGDCYIALHRCEGFGLPIAEASLSGNPVITTGYGGPEDFVRHGETGYLIPYMPTPCYGMPWPAYTGQMEWAEPNLMQARTCMRRVYENKEASKKLGTAGREFIKDELSWEKLGNRMKDRLIQIEKGLS